MNSTVTVEFVVNPLDSGEIYCYNSVKSNPNYIKVLNINQRYDFPIGTVIQCKAESYSDYDFDNWSGANFTNNKIVTFVVSNDILLSANFKAKFLSFSYFSDFIFGLPLIILPSIGVWVLAFFIKPLLVKYIKNKRDQREKRYKDFKKDIESHYNELNDKEELLNKLREKEKEITISFGNKRISEIRYIELYNKILDYINGINKST